LSSTILLIYRHYRRSLHSLTLHSLSILSFSPRLRPPPLSTLFPYTTLFRSLLLRRCLQGHHRGLPEERRLRPGHHGHRAQRGRVDRKSTRLNSSHVSISYAVFCLKKKKGNNNTEYSKSGTEKERNDYRRGIY